MYFFLERNSNKLLNKKKKLSQYLNFISSYKFLNFEFLRSFWKLKMFLQNHKYEQIIIGGRGFLQKNAFSKTFLDKNWNKEVLQQFKA